ncbi:MAG: class I SAM-dependent methyltransferase [bacterium]|nr:class I SAM-dependent methyltransferase [bacterium]
MLYNNPQPAAKAIIEVYKEVEDPLYLEEAKARGHTFKRSLEQLHGFVTPPGKLLDVGCYTGAFMESAHAGGWDVSGVELSSWAAGIAGKLELGPVYNNPLAEVPVEPGSFDVITLWDVIEHLTHPASVMQDVSRLLKPGGILAFSTHMVDSWAVRLLGKRYPFFMDMHLIHFSRATVRRLLQEQGYETMEIMTHRRILKTGYFMEKLAGKMPVGKGLVRSLAGKPFLADRFIGIGCLGLVNIFARKN